jgi:ABC-type hemin transport system substrate-binding protein
VRRFPPERIVCLTEETVETLYLLGEEDRIVAISITRTALPITSAGRFWPFGPLGIDQS